MQLSGSNETQRALANLNGTGHRCHMETMDIGLALAAETFWSEIWPALHNSELWGAAPDGMHSEQWKNDATGWSFE